MSDRTVLCVDDELHVLKSLQRLLRREDYKLITAKGGENGLKVLESEPVHLVMSDQRMPGMSGVEFLKKVKESYPGTVRVVLSGYADVAVMVESINDGEIYRFLPKPWNDEELKTAIRQCLEHYDILQQNSVLSDKIQKQNEELRKLNEGLEEMVQARTRSLQVSQDILEKLPISVLGISSEGMVVLANSHARESYDALRAVSPGSRAADLVPTAIADAISNCLGARECPENPTIEWDGRQVSFQVEALKDGGDIRGCVLILEAIEDE